MNAADLARQMHAAKTDIDLALVEWENRIRTDAEADDEARRSKAREWLKARESDTKATVGTLEAMVDLATSDVQRQARMAEGLKRSAQGAFDAKKQWLSSLQSLAALTKAEAQLASWTPREVESA